MYYLNCSFMSLISIKLPYQCKTECAFVITCLQRHIL